MSRPSPSCETEPTSQQRPVNIHNILHYVVTFNIWFGHLVRMPTGRLPREVFQWGGDLGEDPEPGGGMISQHRPGTAPPSERVNVAPGKEKSGAPCWSCCPPRPHPDKRGKMRMRRRRMRRRMRMWRRQLHVPSEDQTVCVSFVLSQVCPVFGCWL